MGLVACTGIRTELREEALGYEEGAIASLSACHEEARWPRGHSVESSLEAGEEGR